MTGYVLGISAFYHDSAAALVKNGVPFAAAQQERFSRKRHDSGFPFDAIQYCLDTANISLDDVDKVIYYENSELKFDRVLSSFASAGIKGLKRFTEIYPSWYRWKRNILPHIKKELSELKRGEAKAIASCDHHHSHAASAFFPSPFKSAAVLCIDGVGEWHTTTIWHGKDDSLKLVDAISYPHSLGLLYSAFTYYCGFKVDSGEYKLMGLAPYGQPLYTQKIKDHLIHIRADGSFTLNMEYFEFLQGQKMLGKKFEKLFGGATRLSEAAVTQRDCDLAASIQKVTEEVLLGLAKRALLETGEKNICLAGGVALNCVANGVLSRSGLIHDLWIQPAAGDAGSALGAALIESVKLHGRPHLHNEHTNQHTDSMKGALLGPHFDNSSIEDFLISHGYEFRFYKDAEMFDEVAARLADGKIVGWYQGRMEFGPRALGARSILADPRNEEMQKQLNLKTKFRESFRPFAPAVLDEDASKYFDVLHQNPYMLIVSDVNESIRIKGKHNTGLGHINDVRSTLPSITHVDYSARVQTVTLESNERFYALLKSFQKQTGCGVLVNTSFNVRGEPIVNTPEDAYVCFMRTNIDVLVLGNYVLHKEFQPPFREDTDWRAAIPLD